MAALTKERATRAIVGPILSGDGFTIAASTRIFKGAFVGLDASGNAIPAGPDAVSVHGRARRTVDNTASAVPNARTTVETEYGTFLAVPTGTIVAADRGRPVYALDDQTVTLLSSVDDESLPYAGVIHDVTTDGVWVRMYAEANSAVRELALTVGHADLDAAATSQVIALGDLPNNAFVLGVGIDLPTAFSGGSVSALVVDIGTAGNPDAIIDGANVFAAVDGKSATLVSGIAPTGNHGGETISATFVATGANLAALTAGEATLRLAYVIL